MAKIYEARDFAIKAHGNQRYGDQPYGVHLFDVVAIAHDWGATDVQLKAAWLHDVLEDTATTSDQILDLLGPDVLTIVSACTGEGDNRAERSASIHRKIAAHPEAALVKLADRIANVEACNIGDRHWTRYQAENAAFEAAIRPHVPELMWAQLLRALKGSAK